MFLHLFNISSILESLVSFLVVLMLQVLNSFPQILNGLHLGLAVLDEELEMFQGRDDLLHERSHLLCAMLVYQMLKLLQSQEESHRPSLCWSHLADVRRDIINIHQVEIPLFGVTAARTARPPIRSVHSPRQDISLHL